MPLRRLPIKKYNIVVRQDRIPLVKAPAIVGGRLKKRRSTTKKRTTATRRRKIGGGSDPYGRDEPTKQTGDKLWEVVFPLIEHADDITDYERTQIKDLLYRGAWDKITDDIRPQMGTSAAQFFSHIPIIGQPLANISNIVGGL